MKKKVAARKEVELKANMELNQKNKVNQKANMRIIAQTILKMLNGILVSKRRWTMRMEIVVSIHGVCRMRCLYASKKTIYLLFLSR